MLHGPRREKGTLIISDPEFGVTEKATLCCVHCRRHWVVEPGSGKERGFCLRCMGPTCGAKRCDDCLPFEYQLEREEHRARFHRDLARLK